MILLTRGNKVIDVANSVVEVSNGLEVEKINGRKVVYGKHLNLAQTIITTLPEGFDVTKCNEWTYENGEFAKIKKVDYTKTDFLALFTPTEYRAIKTVANDDDILFMFMDLILTLNENVKITDERIVNGVGYIASKGLITPERMNEILGL